MHFEFILGIPFKPFEQLMGVLPEASNEHIPSAYRVSILSLRSQLMLFIIYPICAQELMTDPESPIIDFYPKEFVQDLNGKKQEWEAVVKIPFINEERLLKAMAGANDCSPCCLCCVNQLGSKGASTNFEGATAKHLWHQHKIRLRFRTIQYIPIITARVLPRSSPMSMRYGTIRSAHS